MNRGPRKRSSQGWWSSGSEADFRLAPGTLARPVPPVRLNPAIRDLHLFLGLFLSPFIVVFALSVFFLVHAPPPTPGAKAATRTVSEVAIPPDFEQLKGRDQVAAAKVALARIGVRGEIGFIRQYPKERRCVISVTVPGHETMVDLKVDTRTATISPRTTGVWDAMNYLHKMPGPHNVNIRGNSLFMQVWGWLADATVYLLLFLSLSGVYLWTLLKSERRTGVALLAAGAASFGGLVYALIA